MRRVGAIVLVIAAAVTFAAAAEAGRKPAFRLTPLSSVRFPDRAFVIATPKPVQLTSGSVVTRENGRPVNSVSVIRARVAGHRTFGVVLVLDASTTMRGKPIAAALAAARTFVSRYGSTGEVGLVIFNRDIDVALEPTRNVKAIRTALTSSPTIAEGTRLYDAAARAIDVLRQNKIKAGSVILLTDGHDTGCRLRSLCGPSTVRLEELINGARTAGVRLFAVGLRSPQFTSAPLRRISAATGGAYAEASLAGLKDVYQTRAAQLANEYLLRYRSLAGPGRTVDVAVRVVGLPGVATRRYSTPALPTSAPPAFHRSPFDRFVSSPGSVAVLSLLAAVLAWFGMSAILRPSRSSVRSRVGEFVSVGGAASGTDPASLRVRERLLGHVLLTAERAFQRAPWWERFKEELDIAEFPVRPVPLATATAAASIALALLGFVSPVLGLMALAPPLFARAAYKDRLRRKRRTFEEQLPDNLTVLASSLRAGHSFLGGLSSVLDEAEEPSRSELRRAIADEQIGVPVEDALLRVALRMDSTDLEQIALVASLQRQTGGNTAEVLDAVVDSVRERFKLRRLVRALSAQGRLARWILTALPLVVAGWIGLVNPHYLSPLLHTNGGQILLVIATIMVIAGSVVIKRITDIEI